jgi:hypothetical protein
MEHFPSEGEFSKVHTSHAQGRAAGSPPLLGTAGLALSQIVHLLADASFRNVQTVQFQELGGLEGADLGGGMGVGALEPLAAASSAAGSTLTRTLRFLGLSVTQSENVYFPNGPTMSTSTAGPPPVHVTGDFTDTRPLS